MSDLLDRIEDEETIPSLSQNWKNLQVFIGIVFIVVSCLGILSGIAMEVRMHGVRSFQLTLDILQEFKIILTLFLVPIAVITGAVLLVLEKKLGWLIILASSILLTAFIIYIYINTPNISVWVLLFIIFFGTFTYLLLSKTYRKYYLFKTEDIFYIIGITTILLLIMISIK